MHSGRCDFYASKKLDMIFQLREPLLAEKKTRFEICELAAVTWVGLTTFPVLDEKYH